MDTNDFLQIFEAQERAEAAFAAGAAFGLVIAALLGALAGMAPLIYGALKRRMGLGFIGFLCCVAAGIFGSLFFAVPVAAGFVWWIASPEDKNLSLQASRQTQQMSIVHMNADQFEVLDGRRIKFTSSESGSLHKLKGRGWEFVSSLPRVVELPWGLEETVYKIQSGNKEYVGRFTRDGFKSPVSDHSQAITAQVTMPPVETSIDRLSKLKSLKDSGDITPDEFERLKRHLLESTT